MADEFSFQDLQDLRQIRQSLPPGHPTGAKIDAVLNAAPPNSGLAPPASPQTPVPLQQPQGAGGMSSGKQVLQAGKEGTLSDLMAQDTNRVASVAPAGVGGGLVQPAGRLMEAMSGPVGFIERRFPQLWKPDISGGLREAGGWVQKVASKPFEPPEVPLTQQMGYKYPIPQGGMRGTPLAPRAPAPPAPREVYPQRGPMEGPQYQEPGAGPQRAAQIPQPKPSVGRYQPPERVVRAPRETLIKQMGGRPVEEISDTALKQKMEESPEVSYGKYAKRHQGPSSKAYPEPEQWQDQPSDMAPWGGRFYRK